MPLGPFHELYSACKGWGWRPRWFPDATPHSPSLAFSHASLPKVAGLGSDMTIGATGAARNFYRPPPSPEKFSHPNICSEMISATWRLFQDIAVL